MVPKVQVLAFLGCWALELSHCASQSFLCGLLPALLLPETHHLESIKLLWEAEAVIFGNCFQVVGPVGYTTVGTIVPVTLKATLWWAL